MRKHSVPQYLVDHHWVVAIAETQKFARHQPFVDQGSGAGSRTATTYRVYELEAVLVTGQGFTLPLMTEFAENPEGADEDTNQDCEPKVWRGGPNNGSRGADSGSCWTGCIRMVR